MTHTQLSLSFPHHGSNVNPRNQRPRCCRLHHAGMGGRRDLNSLDRRSPRLGSTLRPRPQFSEQGSNLCLRFQRPRSCRLDDPRASRPPVENRTRVSRLSCGRSAIELQAAASCPVQELNLALRCFRPTLVTTRASGAMAGLASRRHGFLFGFQRTRGRPLSSDVWVSGDSNPVRSGKSRVLDRQSF